MLKPSKKKVVNATFRQEILNMISNISKGLEDLKKYF